MSHIIGTVQVRYNQLWKQWEARNGQLLDAFPAGKEGEQAAIRAAIQHERPELAELAAKGAARWPELASRFWSAAALIINGRLHPSRHEYANEAARVQSSDGREWWIVQASPNSIVCSCPDHAHGRAPIGPARGNQHQQRYCKHILAWVMATKAAREADHV